MEPDGPKRTTISLSDPVARRALGSIPANKRSQKVCELLKTLKPGEATILAFREKYELLEEHTLPSLVAIKIAKEMDELDKDYQNDRKGSLALSERARALALYGLLLNRETQLKDLGLDLCERAVVLCRNFGRDYKNSDYSIIDAGFELDALFGKQTVLEEAMEKCKMD